jgi:4-carboxymuconolactone decarboxylase
MTREAIPPPHPMQRVAPQLHEISERVLFGEVWAGGGLSLRDRSLITVAALVALYRLEQLPFHLKKAIENGVSPEELGALATHLAFYAGWPAAASACSLIEAATRK